MLVIASLAALVLFAAAGCGTKTPAENTGSDNGTREQTATAEAPQAEGTGLYTPTYKPNGSETAVIKTNKGEITVELFGKEAPIHVGNFIELVKKGFYDNHKFHRYEPGFVIQGGDPQTKDLTTQQVAEAVQSGSVPLGTGGPGYNIKGEFDPAINPHKHVDGALGMARSQSPDSAGSQFYFTLAATPFLDGGYTVFGQTVEGLDIVKSLRVGDVIESIEIRGAE